jgi:hypothetical protein
MCRFISRDGRWRVDVIRLSMTGTHRDGERFLICCDGYYIAEAASIAELSQHVDLADLEERLIRCPSSRARAPSAASSPSALAGCCVSAA